MPDGQGLQAPKRFGSNPRDRPPRHRRFYAIDERQDGTADVYLLPVLHDCDVQVRVVRGVIPWSGIEDDIRARFDAWCECGEVIDL